MKSENQIIVRCKQAIKIEKPIQRLLTFPHSAGENNILLTVSLSFFSVYFLNAPNVIMILTEFIFLGINIFRAKYILGSP